MADDLVGCSAELLDPHAVPNALVELIRGSEKWLILISPYFSPWRHLRDALEDARDEAVEIRFLLRADQVEEARQHFETLEIAPQALERLHAKIFVNEREALLTSMNLYSGSRESIEFGLRIERTQDAVLYEDIVEQARSLFRRADPVEIGESGGQRRARGNPQRAEREIGPMSVTKEQPLSRTEYQSYRLWKKERTISEIAAQRDIKPSTVYSHLSAAITAGWVDVKDIVDISSRQKVVAAIRKVGRNWEEHEIWKVCQGNVSYGEMKCVLAALRSQFK